MQKEGEVRLMQGRIVALQSSQLQLKHRVKKLNKSKIRQMEEHRDNQHLRKDNERLKGVSEQLSKKVKEHQQEIVRLDKDTAFLREENAHLRKMRSLPLDTVPKPRQCTGYLPGQ